jgi:hypothetical protein
MYTFYGLVLGAALFCGGVSLFARSLGALRFNRSVIYTPLSRCDAIAVGRVAVTGRAHGLRKTQAPYSQLDCLFACVKVYCWDSDGRRRCSRTDFYPTQPSFTVVDEFGQVTVFPTGVSLRTAASYVGPNPNIAGSLDDFEEFIVREGQQVYVYGWAGECSALPHTLARLGDIPKNGLAIWYGGPGIPFVISDEPPPAFADKLLRTAGIGALFGPAGIILGIVIMVITILNTVFPRR